MKSIDFKRLSKTLSHALRHEPWLYGLELDKEGWTSLDDLLEALHKIPRWENVTAEDLARMNATAPKKRFELGKDRIRALYGHSFEEKVHKEAVKPPEHLYHGAPQSSMEHILQDGLRSMGRQYVHLSTEPKTAYAVARRKTDKACVLLVHAADAYKAGIHFYMGNESIWLADDIPPGFISRMD